MAPVEAEGPDVRVQDEGTLVVLHARTAAARDLFERRMPGDAPRWCGGYVVDHRYAGGIIEDLLAEGLIVE